ncbi:putative membrane protein [Bacillus sp. OxB-1]|uniref:YufK family protein n=1 Tax=Bacillus sp. (strain OxB-1) TaxID=98228 RepID=UPI000581E2F0|nr:YufK family protein [Bacillus sp. OxB-1]BAQ08506.1 putative membrane protein [Bacillus sp. OxB-1]
MKNPYLFGYLPFVTISLFSLTFGVYTVSTSIGLFKEIGLYSGMREFLTDMQLRVFLLVVYALLFFMLFSALKLIAQTIHETAMLFFSKDPDGISYSEARGGNVIYFFGSLVSAGGINSIKLLAGIFLLTTFIYFVFTVYKLSKFMTVASTIGLLVFEITIWSAFLSIIIYILLRLYNGLIASLPFLGNEMD